MIARGKTLIVHLIRPVPDFPARTTFLCAVPPALPAEPEGVGAFPAAGPYYVSVVPPRGEGRPPPQSVLRRQAATARCRLRRRSPGDLVRGGTRPHRARPSRLGLGPPSAYFDPQRRLAAKYGINKSQFFLSPGFEFRGYALNTARPLFRDNPRLRQAVNFAIDRTALGRIFGGPVATQLTDQYLSPRMPGFKDAHIYPLAAPDLRQARALAHGHTRSGKAVLYTPDRPELLAAAQSIKHDLAKIGLDVQIKGVPLPAYFGRLAAHGPYDIGFMPWVPDYLDPYSVLNLLFDGRFIGATNWARFNSSQYNRLLRQAALLQGEARYRRYGELDARLAREAAPMVAVAFFTDPTLVSKRIGCVTRPFDLAAVCLK